MSQSCPEKRNQQDRGKETDYKASAHPTEEADKYQGLQAANRIPRRAGGVGPI